MLIEWLMSKYFSCATAVGSFVLTEPDFTSVNDGVRRKNRPEAEVNLRGWYWCVMWKGSMITCHTHHPLNTCLHSTTYSKGTAYPPCEDRTWSIINEFVVWFINHFLFSLQELNLCWLEKCYENMKKYNWIVWWICVTKWCLNIQHCNSFGVTHWSPTSFPPMVVSSKQTSDWWYQEEKQATAEEYQLGRLI